MRHGPTDAEAGLWRLLRSRRLGGFKFRRQYPLGRYILDFYCHEARLAIELDGGGHAEPEQAAYDEARNRAIEQAGVRLLRVWNNEVLENMEGVAEHIWGLLHALTPALSQGERENEGPLPSGEDLGEGFPNVILRRAGLSDVPAIAALINEYARQNLLLPRTPESVRAALEHFFVAEDEGRVVGCCAVVPCNGDLAEVRSLAVSRSHEGRGLGSALVRLALEEARARGVARVFALTRIPDFFARLGFTRTEMSELPQKVWTDCVRCPLFEGCDELPMIWSSE